MNVIRPGHMYQLLNFDDPRVSQGLQFIEKVPGGDDVNLVTVKDGTTNEEVLKVLIDRLAYLLLKVPCRETALAITKCEEALMWLNRRTDSRAARGVEGTSKL